MELIKLPKQSKMPIVRRHTEFEELCFIEKHSCKYFAVYFPDSNLFQLLEWRRGLKAPTLVSLYSWQIKEPLFFVFGSNNDLLIFEKVMFVWKIAKLAAFSFAFTNAWLTTDSIHFPIFILTPSDSKHLPSYQTLFRCSNIDEEWKRAWSEHFLHFFPFAENTQKPEETKPEETKPEEKSWIDLILSSSDSESYSVKKI